MVVIGDTAFVTSIDSTASWLFSFDVTDCATPVLLDSLSMWENTPRNVIISGGDALIANVHGFLYVVDVYDATTLMIHDSIKTAFSAQDVALFGNYAFVAVSTAGLETVNISDRDSIYPVDTLPLTIDGYEVDARAVHAEGVCVIVGGGGYKGPGTFASCHIINAFYPESPEVIGGWISSFTNCDQVLDIAVKGDYIYLAADDNGILVLSNWPQVDSVTHDTLCYPCYVRSVYMLSFSAKGLDIQGDYLYAAAQAGGEVQVFYLGDPADPKMVGRFQPGYGSSEHLEVVGNRDFVANIGLPGSTPDVEILCQQFSRGDVDDDGEIDDDDVDYLVDYVYYSEPIPKPAAWNGDVKKPSNLCVRANPTVNVADVICLNNFVNNGGAPPDCAVEPCMDCQ